LVPESAFRLAQSHDAGTSAPLASHLQEEQVTQLSNGIAVIRAVVAKGMAETPKLRLASLLGLRDEPVKRFLINVEVCRAEAG